MHFFCSLSKSPACLSSCTLVRRDSVAYFEHLSAFSISPLGRILRKIEKVSKRFHITLWGWNKTSNNSKHTKSPRGYTCFCQETVATWKLQQRLLTCRGGISPQSCPFLCWWLARLSGTLPCFRKDWSAQRRWRVDEPHPHLMECWNIAGKILKWINKNKPLKITTNIQSVKKKS